MLYIFTTIWTVDPLLRIMGMNRLSLICSTEGHQKKRTVRIVTWQQAELLVICFYRPIYKLDFTEKNMEVLTVSYNNCER